MRISSRMHVVLMVAVLAIPARSWAHGSYRHLMGTVKALEPERVQIAVQDANTKTTSDVWVALTAKTTILRGTKVVPITDITVGERIVIDVAETKPPYKAVVVRLPKK